MADEWKNEDGQQGQQSESAQDGQQSQADRQDSAQLAEELEQVDADTMTQPEETSGTSGDDRSFGQSSADGSAFIGSESAGADEDLPDQDPQSDFAERDALTQENDDGMGEAGR